MKTEEYVSTIKNMQAFCNLVQGFFQINTSSCVCSMAFRSVRR